MADTPPPPPPPPEEPFGTGDGNGDAFSTVSSDDDYGGLGQAAPSVAAKPGRVLLVLGAVGAVVALLLYLIFSSGQKEDTSKKHKERTVVEKPVEPPPLPKDPIPVTPPLPVPPVVPEPTKVEIIQPKEDSAAKQQALARMRSGMLVASGGGDSGGILSNDTKPANNDSNSLFAAAVIKANTKADRVESTHIGDLRRTIAQGRIIQATMESALNTDLPAPIRAIVSRDTYGEAGTVPLIPKGSRLIGSYNTELSGGQVRVFVVWTRVIRPDGIDVALGSPLVDQIGQAGIGGQVDSKFQQVFSRAVMASLVSISFASAQDKMFGGQTSTTSNAVGGSTTTGDTASMATVNALNRLGAVTDGFIQKYVDVRPTILVDQGTKVNVFVNRDLVFPSDIAGTRIVN